MGRSFYLFNLNLPTITDLVEGVTQLSHQRHQSFM